MLLPTTYSGMDFKNSFFLYMDYILRYEEPNYTLVLSDGKNNTQAFSQTTL